MRPLRVEMYENLEPYSWNQHIAIPAASYWPKSDRASSDLRCGETDSSS